MVPTIIIAFMTEVFLFSNKPQSHISRARTSILGTVLYAITQNTGLFYLFLYMALIFILFRFNNILLKIRDYFSITFICYRYAFCGNSIVSINDIY